MKRVQQFRYYGVNSPKNSLDGNFNSHTKSQFINGSIFPNPILQLGIQSLPGTKFYVNGNPTPVLVGVTGIYELDLQGEVEINSLAFDPTSLTAIDEAPGSYLLVDVIYDDEED